MLVIQTPGGPHEWSFEEASEEATDGTAPPTVEGAPDVERLAPIAAEYGPPPPRNRQMSLENANEEVDVSETEERSGRSEAGGAPVLRLLPIEADLAKRLDEGPERFRRHYGASVAAEDAPLVRDVVEQTLGMLPDEPRDARWGGYLAVDDESGLVVGSCAFKAPPTEDGTVEIAYYTFGPYEGQGYAKAMARALVSLARSSPRVHRVLAHTLPESNPSTSVLRSVGMRFVNEVHDPEDGPVWRWQLEREARPK